MLRKIVGWLVRARDGKILGFKKNPESLKKNPEKIRKWGILNFCHFTHGYPHLHNYTAHQPEDIHEAKMCVMGHVLSA